MNQAGKQTKSSRKIPCKNQPDAKSTKFKLVSQYS